ncbi:sensor histidine kinase [Catenuloplanes atrovinosus]|uniref:histidine kinase n=1 Tax=Catenuloplanes atrovinosus TaxID=137266 RepID=A0AAE3YK51_9ACTN|nr:ATP-binding protein [Catenuloplanes atrovinosus]MDR7275318.1 PAS domain S-box-containing protein [Catenuloplanes atrovinosus]
MTITPTPTGHPGALARVATAVREARGDPVLRRVAAVSLLGAALAAVVLWLTADRGGVMDGVGLSDAWLVPGLMALTCAAELTVVRLRHGDAVEELSLYEAALIIVVLLLPPGLALLTALIALVVASAVQRRPLVKAVFNLGTYAAAVSGLILVVHAVGGTPGHLTPRVLAGVLLGTLLFTVINLGCLAQILGVVSGVSPWQIIRDEARLSLYMALGTVATGLTTVEIARHSPMLLPFMALPALALTFAYRAAAQEADERARSARLLELSQVLAEREDLIRRFLLLVRDAFDADIAVAVTVAGTAVSVDADAPGEVATGPIPAYLERLGDPDRPAHLTTGLTADLRDLLVVPVEAGGRRFGTVALGARTRRGRRLSTRDLTLLAPLGNALAVALRGAEHLDRLVEESSKLHAVVEQSSAGIVMVEEDGVVRMWNEAFAELTGVSAAAADGRPLAGLLDVPDDDDRAGLLPVTPASPQTATELTIRRPDGELRRLRLAHSAVFDTGRLVRDVVVITDLTREYRAERLKSDFIATVSHELRTPLTPIIGYLDLLRTRGDRMTPQKRAQSLELVADRARHMSRLVEDLLLASRVGDGQDEPALRVDLGAHDLVALVRQVTGDLGGDGGRIVTDVPGEPVPVRCDAGRTVQVVGNLVGNALKYSPADARVDVRLHVRAELAWVDVTDRGRGIPADQLEKVFEKFHRVEDPMTMSTGGTGLGLFIARRLAQAMDGDIAVTSTLGVGSTFTLALPLAEPVVPDNGA